MHDESGLEAIEGLHVTLAQGVRPGAEPLHPAGGSQLCGSVAVKAPQAEPRVVTAPRDRQGSAIPRANPLRFPRSALFPPG